MEKTENYNLPQWSEGDPVRREKFNEAFAAIDTMQVIGSYTGNGAELTDGGLHVELGFRPRFVIISKGWTTISNVSPSSFMITEYPAENAKQFAVLDETGFTVGLCADAGTYTFKLNTSDITYSFIAFR